MIGFAALAVNTLIGGLLISLPTLIKRVLIALGVGAVVFTGLDLSLTYMQTQVLAQLGSLPAMAANIAGILNIDTAVNIIISAYSMRLTFKLLGGAAPKQIRLL